LSFRGLMRFALATAATGKSQNFLGAPWVTGSLQAAPQSWKRPLALRLLALSPHYFYRNEANARLATGEFLESEYRRNRDSRQLIVDDLISPFLQPDFVCLDYGCGPGFLALAAAQKSAKVIACDISAGVLACASIINHADNIAYRRVGGGHGIPVDDDSIDLAYSFAVFQHVTDKVLQSILDEFRRVMKPGATAVCHIVLDAAGWKSESYWRADTSLKGRLKWQIGLHCFSRTQEGFEQMLTAAGLRLVRITPVSELVKNPSEDDIEKQHLCVFTR
jgi:SAM-dependent methyltransferase